MMSGSAWPVCALIQPIVIYMCFEFEEESKIHLIFPTSFMNACMELEKYTSETCGPRVRNTALITYSTRGGSKENICCQTFVELGFVGFLG